MALLVLGIESRGTRSMISGFICFFLLCFVWLDMMAEQNDLRIFEIVTSGTEESILGCNFHWGPNGMEESLRGSSGMSEHHLIMGIVGSRSTNMGKGLTSPKTWRLIFLFFVFLTLYWIHVLHRITWNNAWKEPSCATTALTETNVHAGYLKLTSSQSRWVVGLALLADTVPQERLAQAMGYVSMGMSLGILIAPMLGGIVFDRAGYNAVFGMAYALIGIDIVLRLLLVEKKAARQWDNTRFEAEGGVRNVGEEDEAQLPSNRCTVTQDAASQINDHLVESRQNVEVDTNAKPEEPVLQTTNIVRKDSDGPVAVDSTQSLPLSGTTPGRPSLRDRLPPLLSLLYSRRLLSALFGSIVQAALVTSFDSVLTLHAAHIFSWTSTGAALLFLPLVIPTFLAPIFGWLSDRIGGRYPASLGFLLAAPPLVCLRFVDENTTKDKVLLCALLALTGLTLSLTFPPLMAEFSQVAEAKEQSMLKRTGHGFGKGGAYAQAYALFNVAFAAGCMLGPLLAGFVVEKDGWGVMAGVLGGLSGVTAIPTFLLMGGWVLGKRKGSEELAP